MRINLVFCTLAAAAALSLHGTGCTSDDDEDPGSDSSDGADDADDSADADDDSADDDSADDDGADDSPDASTEPTVDAAPACELTSGLFQCGAPTDDVSCEKDLDFCVVGDPVFGTACKSIGGDGSTCPRCDAILAIVKEIGTCGDATPTCAGDETTGITITCNPR